MVSPLGRRWVFTANNYTPEHVTALNRFGANCVYFVYGHERAPTTGTRHLQGFFILENPKRRPGIIREIGFPLHLELARGTSVQCRDYCKKDGDSFELGTFPDNAGKRSDIDEIISWLDDFIATHGRAPSGREVAASQPKALLRYRNFMELARLRAPEPDLVEGEYGGWQDELASVLDGEPDDRTVNFFVDPEGGKGKTWFQKMYWSKNKDDVQLLGVGKIVDVAYAIDETKRVFLFNVPRTAMQYLQYTILEQLKDRFIFSTKYQSSMKVVTRPCHVIVFCNEPPDMTKMTADRYVITEL